MAHTSSSMNPTQLEQVRAKTSFEPLFHNNAANFATYRLDFSSKRHVRVISTLGLRLFVMLFLLVSGGILTLGILQKQYIAIFCGILFMLADSLFFFRKRITFDLLTGTFTHGKRRVDFSQIAALQVIPKNCHTGKGRDYLAWELNLVLEDGSRINILNHSGRKVFENDVTRLADAMDLKVWSRNGTWSPKDDEKQEQQHKSKNDSPGCLIIFGLLFGGIPLIMLTLLLIKPLTKHCLSANWVECPAVVTASNLESSYGGRSRTYRIDIAANYEWEGRTLTCKRYDFFRSGRSTNIGVNEMRRIVESLPQGTQTYCLVNPDNPEESVMRRQLPSLYIFLLVLFMLPFIAFGGFAVYSGIKGLRNKRRQDSSQNPLDRHVDV